MMPTSSTEKKNIMNDDLRIEEGDGRTRPELSWCFLTNTEDMLKEFAWSRVCSNRNKSVVR
jgi:hypothetical protein